MTTIFDEIRDGAAEVAEMATDISLESGAITEYAQKLARSNLEEPTLDPDYHYLGHGEATVAYLVMLDTVNFGSGYFPWVQPREGVTDYHMIADALREHFDKHGPPDPADLADIDTDSCARVFDQEIEHDARRKLMASFGTAWRELGSHLQSEWDGSYTALVDAADGSAARLVELLSEMSLFRDVVLYRNVEIPFYNRAQRLASQLQIAFDGQNWGAFDDIDQLTAFADNTIPHVLRLDGVLSYSEPLAEQVDSRRGLEPASTREIEIRACAVHAVERIVDALDEQDVTATARQVHETLWRRGQQDRYRVRPAHLTRSVFY